MERIFTTPVSMQVTEEQYNYLIPELDKLGYITYGYINGNNNITNNGDNWNGRVALIYDEQIYRNSRYFIDHYNPELFLALAACSKGDTFYDKEWLVGVGFDGVYKFTVGNFYQSMGKRNVCCEFVYKDDIGGSNNGLPPKYFRKATKEELINHFTKQGVKSLDELQKEVNQDIGNRVAEINWNPVNGETVLFSVDNKNWAKGLYIGKYIDDRHVVYYSEYDLVRVNHIKKLELEPKKVTRKELSELLGTEHFEIIN